MQTPTVQSTVKQSGSVASNGAPNVQPEGTRPPTPSPVLPTFASALERELAARDAELARVTAERDDALKARKERETVLGRLVQQMEKDDDEYEAQLAQARSELETALPHREGLITEDEFATLTMIGSVSARRLESYDDLQAKLAAAHQTIADYEKKLRHIEGMS